MNLYSDLLLHHMGPLLADGIGGSAAGFGQATGDQWRTAPLWGLSFRTVYLHDGRDSSVMQAIEDHFSLSNGSDPKSEATQVITNFNNLMPQDQTHLNYLHQLAVSAAGSGFITRSLRAPCFFAHMKGRRALALAATQESRNLSRRFFALSAV